ncbi:cytochrome P450 [Syncephalis plumigaleata]|nr:cytochrome P450 [Syncephalis plumigaleata]
MEVLLDWKFVAIVCGASLLSKLFSPIAKIPGVRPAIIARLITLYQMATGNYTAYSVAMSQRYGKIYRLSSNAVATIDPDALKVIYSSTKFSKPESYRNFAFHRESIFSTRNAEHHRQLKRLIGPAFSATSITELEPLIYEAGAAAIAAQVSRYADTGESFDIMKLFHCATLDVIGEVAFGGSFHTLKADGNDTAHPVFRWINDMTYLGMLKNVFGRLCHPWIMPKYFESERLLIERINSMKDEQVTDSTRVKDVLQRLIEAVDPETGNRLDIDQIIAESIVQLLGGTDTTALNLTWTLHFILEHPAIHQRLEHELLVAIPDRDQVITHSTVKHLPLLNAVILESMRLRTVGGASQRVVPSGGVVICDVYLPQGVTTTTTICYMSLLFCANLPEQFVIHPVSSAIHLTPQIFGENTECFHPDRWLNTTPEKRKLMRQNLLAFSMGARACLGQSLAWMELQLTLSILIRRFVITIPSWISSDMRPVRFFGLKPRGGRLDVLAVHRPY